MPCSLSSARVHLKDTHARSAPGLAGWSDLTRSRPPSWVRTDRPFGLRRPVFAVTGVVVCSVSPSPPPYASRPRLLTRERRPGKPSLTLLTLTSVGHDPPAPPSLPLGGCTVRYAQLAWVALGAGLIAHSHTITRNTGIHSPTRSALAGRFSSERSRWRWFQVATAAAAGTYSAPFRAFTTVVCLIFFTRSPSLSFGMRCRKLSSSFFLVALSVLSSTVGSRVAWRTASDSSPSRCPLADSTGLVSHWFPYAADSALQCGRR